MLSTSAAAKTNSQELPVPVVDGNRTLEDFQGLASAMEMVIQNVVTQGQINNALVKRLVSLEKKIEALAAGAQRSQTVPTPSPAQGNDPLPIYLGNSLIMCRVLNTFPMYVDARDPLSTPSLLLEGMWEPVLSRLFTQSLKRRMTVVDVGANHGYYTLLAGAAVGPSGRVFAFEPEPRNLDILIRNVQLNSMSDRVEVHSCAVTDARGRTELYLSPRNSLTHTLFPSEQDRASAAHVTVDAVALDDVIAGSVDFVKIDAEGSEPLIVKGMKGILDRSPDIKVLMEFNPDALRNAGVNPLEFYQSLAKMGLRSRVVTKEGVLAEVQVDGLLRQELTALFLTHA